MKHLLGYRPWGKLLTQTATLHPQPFPPAWEEHHWDSALLWEQDPASTCFVPLRKQTAFSFSVCKAAPHLFKWQLQRPSMTLNNNRKLNQRVCRGIQSFPFHHRLQRPFFLKGSQEYAGQWTSLSLQMPPLSILFPQTGGWGQVFPLAKWSYNPGAWFGPNCCIQGNTGWVQTSLAFERPGEPSHLLCIHFHQILPYDSTKKFSKSHNKIFFLRRTAFVLSVGSSSGPFAAP